MIEEQTNPTVLVFYLDRDLMSQRDIIFPYMQSVQDAIAEKKANMFALFLPTDGEERVECINPIMYEKGDIDKLNVLIEDIKTNFDIGQGADEGKNE